MKIPNDEIKKIIAKSLNISIDKILDIHSKDGTLYVKVLDNIEAINTKIEVTK